MYKVRLLTTAPIYIYYFLFYQIVMRQYDTHTVGLCLEILTTYLIANAKLPHLLAKRRDARILRSC